MTSIGISGGFRSESLDDLLWNTQKHVATMIYMTGAVVMEEESPYRPGTHNNGPDDVRSKDEIIAFLKGSLA